MTKCALTIPNDVSYLTGHSSLVASTLKSSKGPVFHSSILLFNHPVAFLMDDSIRTSNSCVLMYLIHNQTNLYSTTGFTALYAETRIDLHRASSMRRGVYN